MKLDAVLIVASALVLATLWVRAEPGGPAAPSAEAAVAAGNAERGRYIAESIVMCVECHSSRDARGEILPDTRYKGGVVPVKPPWKGDWAVHAPRIAGLPDYSDAEALRLFTGGAVGRKGVQLKPPMPRFQMNREDAADLIVFIRSLH